MTTPPVTLDALDAVELGELLEFLHDATVYAPDLLGDALARYTGGPGYPIAQLRADLARFAFLLPGGDGERLLRD